MFNVLRKEPPTSKLYVSQGRLSHKFDFDQPPSKKKPFSTILNQPFTHSAHIVLPAELYESVWKDVSNKLQTLEYSRVIMPLSALLEGDFFNTYIKSGAPGGHDVIRSLTASAIDLNLRSPSMLHGKKGFERIVWAFKNVLDSAVTWLFYDFEVKPDGSTTTTRATDHVGLPVVGTETAPLAKHHPVAKKCEPFPTLTASVKIPESINGRSAPWPPTELEDCAVEMDEWLNLVMLQSPRIRQNDHIDPYLCRYATPSEDSSEVGSLLALNGVSPIGQRPFLVASKPSLYTLRTRLHGLKRSLSMSLTAPNLSSSWMTRRTFSRVE
ncbi:MAG: hypothetical protein Q9199_003824 [Rusavskia elegans]